VKFDALSNQVIGCAIEVHKQLGPGLLESAYERCLSFELSGVGIRHSIQPELPIEYKSIQLENGYRVDVLIDMSVLELKSVDRICRFMRRN
jgi:GxxExxY protein